MKNLSYLISLFCSILFGLDLSAQGSNCASATVAVIGANTTDGPSDGLGFEDYCNLDPGATNADWFTFTPSNTASITIESCLQNVDTRISVFSGDCNGLTCVANNDDFCELSPGGNNWASSVTFPGNAGSTYYIQWDNRWSSLGFTWTLSLGDLDCPELNLNIGNGCDFMGTNDGIVNEACECELLGIPDCPSLQSPVNGEVEVVIDPADNGINLFWSINGPEIQEGLNFYWGTAPDALEFVGSLPASSVAGTISNVDPGLYYWSVVPFNAVGEATGCEVFFFVTENAGSAGLANCPTLVSPSDNAINVALNADSSIDLNWSNSTTGPVASLNGVYLGTNPSALNFYGQYITDIDLVNIEGLEAGLTYYWSIEPQNFSGTTLNCDVFSFTVEGEVDCPSLGPNGLNFGNNCDDGDPNTYIDVVAEDTCICEGRPLPTNTTCNGALPISEGTFLDNKIFDGGGALNLCYNDGLSANSLWYSYTATCNGQVTVSSSIDLDLPDTRVSIYTGTCNDLLCVTQDDDSGEEATSAVSFPISAGTEYFIEWDDRWDDAIFDFELSAIANPTCQDEDKDNLEQVWVALDSPSLTGWNFSSCNVLNDSWEGIIMTADGCNVKEIDLSSKGLTGNLDPAIGNFSEMTDLNLSNNSLTGSIPSELGDLGLLENLELNNNMLSGDLPFNLGNLSALEILNLNSNQLIGCIPFSFQSYCGSTIVSLNNNLLLTIEDFSLFCLDGSGNCDDIQLNIKAYLNGPLDIATFTMKDDLRVGGFLPLNEPYTAMGYTHVGGGGEVTTQAVLDAAGSQAVVDWIFVELRDALNPTAIAITKSALILKDGSIVDVDGTSNLMVANPGVEDFIVVLRHRNHLGVASGDSYQSNALAVVDFTDINFITSATSNMEVSNGVQVLIGGDANGDNATNVIDKNVNWRIQNSTTFNYFITLADFNLDGAINSFDKNLVWRVSNGSSSVVD